MKYRIVEAKENIKVEEVARLLKMTYPKYAELRGFLVTKDAHGLYEKYGYQIINNRAMMKTPGV